MSGLEAIRASVARAPIFAGGPAETAASPGACAIETTRCGLSKLSFILSSRSTPPAFTSEPGRAASRAASERVAGRRRSEEHTSELQSLAYLVCRLLLEKK